VDGPIRRRRKLRARARGRGLRRPCHGHTVTGQGPVTHRGREQGTGAKASEKAGDGEKGTPTQSDERRERGSGQGGQVEEQTASKAAGKRNHGVKESLDKGKRGKEGLGSTRRLMQMLHPQGAVSAPPFQPPPRPAQARSGQTSTRSATGAPANLGTGRNRLRLREKLAFSSCPKG
jgi:hypothetical protein